MFCGIVEETGTISERAGGPQGARFTIRWSAVHEDLKAGESVAVDGVCLTATQVTAGTFAVDVSPETLRVTTLGALRVGSSINLERAMKLDQRIGGHLMSGHVDGTGLIVERHEMGNTVAFQISVDHEILRYCIVKGSVAVDGVSLTINRISSSAIEVAIIPHTAEMTTFRSKQVGDPVNIEADMIGKYIERMFRSSGY